MSVWLPLFVGDTLLAGLLKLSGGILLTLTASLFVHGSMSNTLNELLESLLHRGTAALPARPRGGFGWLLAAAILSPDRDSFLVRSQAVLGVRPSATDSGTAGRLTLTANLALWLKTALLVLLLSSGQLPTLAMLLFGAGLILRLIFPKSTDSRAAYRRSAGTILSSLGLVLLGLQFCLANWPQVAALPFMERLPEWLALVPAASLLGLLPGGTMVVCAIALHHNSLGAVVYLIIAAAASTFRSLRGTNAQPHCLMFRRILYTDTLLQLVLGLLLLPILLVLDDWPRLAGRTWQPWLALPVLQALLLALAQLVRHGIPPKDSPLRTAIRKPGQSVQRAALSPVGTDELQILLTDDGAQARRAELSRTNIALCRRQLARQLARMNDMMMLLLNATAFTDDLKTIKMEIDALRSTISGQVRSISRALSYCAEAVSSPGFQEQIHHLSGISLAIHAMADDGGKIAKALYKLQKKGARFHADTDTELYDLAALSMDLLTYTAECLAGTIRQNAGTIATDMETAIEASQAAIQQHSLRVMEDSGSPDLRAELGLMEVAGYFVRLARNAQAVQLELAALAPL